MSEVINCEKCSVECDREDMVDGSEFGYDLVCKECSRTMEHDMSDVDLGEEYGDEE